MEVFQKSKAQAPADEDRNPPLDADILYSLRSLIIAHAGLITLFPDAKQTSLEFDEYRELSESIDTFRFQVLDSTISKLASSINVFDDKTTSITEEIRLLSDIQQSSGQTPTQGEIAIKHSWIRGALTSIGNYLLKQGGESTKVLRDAIIKKAVEHPDKLSAAIVKFLHDSKDVLSSLAHRFEGSLGWIETLLSYLGIK